MSKSRSKGKAPRLGAPPPPVPPGGGDSDDEDDLPSVALANLSTSASKPIPSTRSLSYHGSVSRDDEDGGSSMVTPHRVHMFANPNTNSGAYLTATKPGAAPTAASPGFLAALARLRKPRKAFYAEADDLTVTPVKKAYSLGPFGYLDAWSKSARGRYNLTLSLMAGIRVSVSIPLEDDRVQQGKKSSKLALNPPTGSYSAAATRGSASDATKDGKDSESVPTSKYMSFALVKDDFTFVRRLRVQRLVTPREARRKARETAAREKAAAKKAAAEKAASGGGGGGDGGDGSGKGRSGSLPGKQGSFRKPGGGSARGRKARSRVVRTEPLVADVENAPKPSDFLGPPNPDHVTASAPEATSPLAAASSASPSSSSPSSPPSPPATTKSSASPPASSPPAPSGSGASSDTLNPVSPEEIAAGVVNEELADLFDVETDVSPAAALPGLAAPKPDVPISTSATIHAFTANAAGLHENTLQDRATDDDVEYDFYFVDYAPLVFHGIRETFGVKQEAYLQSLTRGPALNRLITPGKSGSAFYFSFDGRFAVKTVDKSELELLLAILPSYYQHLVDNPNTLLPRFYGAHEIAPVLEDTHYIIVMANVFSSDLAVHMRFDLKGSKVGRRATKKERANAESVVFKDNDFVDRKIYLGSKRRKQFLEQLTRDCKFLESLGLIDYSLLLGIHVADSEDALTAALAKGSNDGSAGGDGADSAAPAQQPSQRSRTEVLRRELAALGGKLKRSILGGQPSVSIWQRDHGGTRSAAGSDRRNPHEVYFFGIVDILTPYGFNRKMQHMLKSVIHDGNAISTVAPDKYSRRLIDYITSISE